jgi:Tol biopolymer transport system component
MRKLLLLAAMTPLFGCSASLRHGVTTTDAARGLEQVTRSSSNEFDPAVSPDGKSIAYESADSPASTPHVEVTSLSDLTAGHRPRVEYSSKDATGMAPAWTPDGRAIVFQSDALGTSRLVETIGDGIQTTRFLGRVGQDDLYGAWPALSSGGRLAFSLGPTLLFRTGWRTTLPLDATIGVTDVAGSTMSIIGAGTDPAWSPHGRRIAFARWTGGHMHLFVSDADGSNTTQITDGIEDDRQPTWSPDGRYIAYCSMHSSDAGDAEANLFVVRPDGSGLAQLTEGDRLACRPDWANDGFIYFHANATDRFHVWRIRPIEEN